MDAAEKVDIGRDTGLGLLDKQLGPLQLPRVDSAADYTQGKMARSLMLDLLQEGADSRRDFIVELGEGSQIGIDSIELGDTKDLFQEAAFNLCTNPDDEAL